MYGAIYCATCTLNGKTYVGMSVRPRYRRTEHEKAALSGSEMVFHKAIRKYGVAAFNWDILDTAESREELITKEIYWIDALDSLIGRNGYNMKAGGLGGACAREEGAPLSKTAELKKRRADKALAKAREAQEQVDRVRRAVDRAAENKHYGRR